jgi:hypothetical protein
MTKVKMSGFIHFLVDQATVAESALYTGAVVAYCWFLTTLYTQPFDTQFSK